MKRGIAAVFALALLSACGEGGRRSQPPDYGVQHEEHSQDCEDSGGDVVTIGTTAKCVFDGAVVAEWYAP